MKISRVLAQLKYYWQFNPFRLNFVLFVIVLIGSLRWLKHYQTDTSSFSGITILMAKIALFFSLSIITISFLSSFFCFIYFLIKKENQPSKVIDIWMDVESMKNSILKIKTSLPFGLKPILGFVKVQLRYDHTKLTQPYLITERIKKQFFSFNTGLAGTNELQLPDIKEYHFSDALISFEDMLQFFSFTMHAEVNQTICKLPTSLLRDTNELPPKKTEEEIVRIEQLRKVEGEYLNYKKFEDSDDVRRIVWKIFAKNKELVVRIPEIMDPFASHIYMYASFYHSNDFKLNQTYYQEMLNHFKNCVWTIFDALEKKDFEVRYITDQPIRQSTNEINQTKYTIALSEWHHDNTLENYFKAKSGSVLCIHSYTPVKELEHILASVDQHTTIFFIQLSTIFKSHYILNWILRIFMKAPEDRLSTLRNKWALHPLKFQTLHQEKELLSILKKSELNLEII